MKHSLLVWKSRYGGGAAAVLLILLIAATALLIPEIQGSLERLLASEEMLQALRSFFLTLGGALLGATAIVASLVLFSMQVNVERMPHGLFRRLSSDLRLLSGFAGAFFLATVICTLSLMPDRTWMGFATFVGTWAMMLVLILFLYAYRRALILINPARQLEIVVASTQRELQGWMRRAQRAAPLLEVSREPKRFRVPIASTHDMTRVAYFQVNAHWANGAKQSVHYASSFARRFAELGDHEVSAAAMHAIVAVNAAYVQAKGKTFFAHHFMFDNPLTSDGLINDTLEQLRQTARVGVSRGDEQQIEHTLRAFAELVGVYATINYVDRGASMTHAHLAAGYLYGEVERLVGHNLPDVLMEGVRLMGQSADILLAAEGPDSIRNLIEKIGTIGWCGISNQDCRPVTSTAVEQLARLSFNLLRMRSGEIKYVAKQVRSSITQLAKHFLSVPDSPLSTTHSMYLGPYYSTSRATALPAQLVLLANSVAAAEAHDEAARQLIDNVADWSDSIYRTEKELLLEAINRRSAFTFDVVHWISQVTATLLAISNAQACSEHNRKALRKHAIWLISVLSFIPGDPETVRFVESASLTETFFDAAFDAHNRDCPDIAADIAHLLISWMFKGGQHQTGWAILERSLYGLAVLASLDPPALTAEELKAEISKRLAAAGLPEQDVRDDAARDVRSRAATLYRQGHWTSSIEIGMARVDHKKLEPLLQDLADLISPETAGEAVSLHLL